MAKLVKHSSAMKHIQSDLHPTRRSSSTVTRPQGVSEPLGSGAAVSHAATPRKGLLKALLKKGDKRKWVTKKLKFWGSKKTEIDTRQDDSHHQAQTTSASSKNAPQLEITGLPEGGLISSTDLFDSVQASTQHDVGVTVDSTTGTSMAPETVYIYSDNFEDSNEYEPLPEISGTPTPKALPSRLGFRRQRQPRHIQALEHHRAFSDASTLIASPTASESQVSKAEHTIENHHHRNAHLADLGPDKGIFDKDGELLELRPRGGLRISPVAESYLQAYEGARAQIGGVEASMVGKDHEIEDLRDEVENKELARSTATRKLAELRRELREQKGSNRVLQTENDRITAGLEKQKGKAKARKEELRLNEQRYADNIRLADTAGAWCNVTQAMVHILQGTLEERNPVMHDVLVGALHRKDEMIAQLQRERADAVRQYAEKDDELKLFRSEAGPRIATLERGIEVVGHAMDSAVVQREEWRENYSRAAGWFRERITPEQVAEEVNSGYEALELANQRSRDEVQMLVDSRQPAHNELRETKRDLAVSEIARGQIQSKYEAAELERNRLARQENELKWTSDAKVEDMRGQLAQAVDDYEGMRSRWYDFIGGLGAHPALHEINQLRELLTQRTEECNNVWRDNAQLTNELMILGARRYNHAFVDWAWNLQELEGFWARSGRARIDRVTRPHVPYARGVMRALCEEVGIEYDATMDLGAREVEAGASVIDPRVEARAEAGDIDPEGTRHANQREEYRLGEVGVGE